MNSERALLEESINKVEQEYKPPPEDVLYMVDSDEDIAINSQSNNGLNWEKMNLYRNINHPRAITCDQENKKTIYKKHGICSTRTGCSHCLKNMRNNDMNAYGVGIVLYFQFLKYVGIVMFVLSLISVPSFLIFMNGTNQYEQPTGSFFKNNEDLYSNFNKIIYSFSLGNIGELHNICREVSIDTGNITLTCENRGLLTSVHGIGQYNKNEINNFECKSIIMKDKMHEDDEDELTLTEHEHDIEYNYKMNPENCNSFE